MLPWRKDQAEMSVDLFREAIRMTKGWPGIYAVFGGNPSLRAGTRVFTTAGIFPIEDLEDRVFHTKSLDGRVTRAFCRLSGTDQPLYEIRLKGGQTYFATADHKWPALNWSNDRPGSRRSLIGPNRVRTIELRPGMRLPVIRTADLGFGADGTREDGFLAGWLMGDGWITHRKREYTLRKASNRANKLRRDGECDRRFRDDLTRSVGLIVNETDRRSKIDLSLRETLGRLGSNANWRARKSNHEISVCRGVDDWLTRFGIINKASGLPAAIWTSASEAFRRGFIDGLFSSDGHIDTSRRKGFASIRLTTAHERMARDISDLLGFYGIRTTIRDRSRQGSFPNGKDYGRDYTSFEVSIDSTADVEHFAGVFRLSHDEKRRRLNDVVGRHRRNTQSWSVEIESVILSNVREDVWDVSVEDVNHCFQLAHCMTGNCTHSRFADICQVFIDEGIPQHQRGLWTNNLLNDTIGKLCQDVFYPAGTFNLNAHTDQRAAALFDKWLPGRIIPSSRHQPSMHGPMMMDYRDFGIDEKQWIEWRERCDINQNWSGMVAEFDGKLYGYFCEIAAAIDAVRNTRNGVPLEHEWWRWRMDRFQHQVSACCDSGCGVPLRRVGSRDIDGKTEVSKSWLPLVQATIDGVSAEKKRERMQSLVVLHEKLPTAGAKEVTDYARIRTT